MNSGVLSAGLADASIGRQERDPDLRYDCSGVECLQWSTERVFRLQARNPKGMVIFAHGLTDHPGRHFSTARLLAEAGYSTLALELAGHGGRSAEPERSRPVYEAYAAEGSILLQSWVLRESIGPALPDFRAGHFAALRDTRFEHHVRQMRKVLDRVSLSPKLSRLPLFLMGFSMGGLVAADSALRQLPGAYGLDLRGVILLSPAFRPKGRPGNRVENWLIERLWEQRDGAVPLVRPAANAALGFNFPLDCRWGARYMSDLGEEIELYRSDPLVLTEIPSAYAASIEGRMAEIDACAEDLSTDSLFLFPARDGITSLPGGLEFAERVRSAAPARCQIRRFETIGHDLRRSSVRDDVVSTVRSWLDSRV